MNWYYKIQGIHTHVRVFMNGGNCGTLVFRNDEFQEIMRLYDSDKSNILNITAD